MQSNNPVLKRQFQNGVVADGAPMSINGTIHKTFILLALAMVTAGWTWQKFMASVGHAQELAGWDKAAAISSLQSAMGEIQVFLWGGLIVGLVLALITVFKPRWAHITAPAYALAEGFVLGGLSAYMEMRYPGIVMQAVMLTLGVLAVMLVAYRTRIIKVTKKFRMMVVSATGAVMLFYMVDLALRAFTSISIPFIHESGAMGIGFSLFVVGLAAFNLALDFDMIERGAEQGAPKYMEWFSAFALMVTLVWLYLEILRLLAKMRR